MRSLIMGFLGALACLIAAAIIYPMYCNQVGVAQSSGWFATLLPVMQQIEATAKQQKTLAGAGTQVGKVLPTLKGVDFLSIEDQGTIIARGGSDGQVMVLIPKIDADYKVTWHCVGGSASSVWRACRDHGEQLGPFSS